MARFVLKGLNGSNPLGFMASVGLLRLLSQRCGPARLGFTEDGTFRAWVECDSVLSVADIVDVIETDAVDAKCPQSWWLEYKKTEKGGTKTVADLKAPPDKFLQFLALAINEWTKGRPERAEYAAAYGTDVAVDGKGNTKPTALHFTAANQQFLGALENEIRSRVTREWIKESLDDGTDKTKPGSNLRWDPDAERSRALMGVNPNDDGTAVNAPLEWLAFRGLPFFRCVPIGDRIVTCGVTGRRHEDFRFHWPLWSCGASCAAVNTLISLTAAWVEDEEALRLRIERSRKDALEASKKRNSVSELLRDLEDVLNERRIRGVFAVCTSAIRRSAQGFGNFGPAYVRA